MDPEEPTIGQLIRERRLQLGLSLRDLQAASGISRGNISGIEAGTRRPGLRTLQRLAPVLQVSLADLGAAAGHPTLELPTMQPYLRAAYGLSAASAADVERYVRANYGTPSQPLDGEDEQPDGYVTTDDSDNEKYY